MEKIRKKIEAKAYQKIYRINRESRVRYWFYGLVIFMLIFLFLPWTQNIKAKGLVTTLYQSQRPQDINSPIPGKITKWYVNEGDFVKKGDTLLQLAEVKDEYLAPNLIEKTKEQVDAKKGSLNYYKGKVSTTELQMNAFRAAKNFKLEQLRNKRKQLLNKLVGERAELQAIENEYDIASDQFHRQQKMFEEGLVSQTQLQQRNIIFQQTLAKKIVVENKLAQTQQDLSNVDLEQLSVEQEYNEKISKTEGEKYSSLSEAAKTKGDLAKLENQISNYQIRSGMYVVLAPQDGQIVQSKKAGIGEMLKAGEKLMVFVPNDIDMAVELFVNPIDLPLIRKGQKIRFTFDGYPAIVFSGWPNNSYGTFGGKVVAVENTISTNGKFRVLVAADKKDRTWPEQLKVGSGAYGIALLKDVPIWYELWRNINGFPPDYYTQKDAGSSDKSSSK